jgi:hypothetical protein
MEPVLRIRDMTKEELGYWKKYNYSSKELIQRIIELESLLVEV